MNINLKALCDSVCQLSIQVGGYIKRQIKGLSIKDIHQKGYKDYVTEVDIASEKQLTRGLKKLLPFSEVLAEECSNKISNKGEYLWIVDPLDGTTNYMHGFPFYAVSTGLMYRDEIILGVVYEISRDECFYTYKSSRSYLNGKVIKVSDTKSLHNGIFATGFPYSDYARLESLIKFLNYIVRNTHGIRRCGSAATELCYVACGRLDGFYEYALKPWDVAAGTLIVKNAGGIISDFTANLNYIFGKEIVASNKYIYPEFIDAIKKFKLFKEDK